MNWSAEVVALVPTGVVTVMSTTPAPAGALALSWVPPAPTVTLVAALVPKSTALASVKLAPVMLTGVPPMVRPATGLTVLTDGTAS